MGNENHVLHVHDRKSLQQFLRNKKVTKEKASSNSLRTSLRAVEDNRSAWLQRLAKHKPPAHYLYEFDYGGKCHLKFVSLLGTFLFKSLVECLNKDQKLSAAHSKVCTWENAASIAHCCYFNYHHLLLSLLTF